MTLPSKHARTCYPLSMHAHMLPSNMHAHARMLLSMHACYCVNARMLPSKHSRMLPSKHARMLPSKHARMLPSHARMLPSKHTHVTL